MGDTETTADNSRLNLLASLIRSAKAASPQSLLVCLKIKDGTDYWSVVLNGRSGQGQTFDIAAGKLVDPPDGHSQKAADPGLVDSFDQLIRATRRHEDEPKWLILMMIGKGDGETWRVVIGGDLGQAPNFMKAALAALEGKQSHRLRVAKGVEHERN